MHGYADLAKFLTDGKSFATKRKKFSLSSKTLRSTKQKKDERTKPERMKHVNIFGLSSLEIKQWVANFKIKKSLQKSERARNKELEKFQILSITNHKRDFIERHVIHTAVCETNRSVDDFDLLAIKASREVDYDIRGYMYFGVKKINFLGKNKYQISWETRDNCD